MRLVVAAVSGHPIEWRRMARALAGPLVIVVGVCIVLNGFVRGLITTGDPLRFWMPTYCYLGRSLVHGHIPAWNPFVMGGVPFAADPQSGWMYLPVMALFTALPCQVAIRVLIVAQPALAGLGIYWFARSEGLGRPAATVGGSALALAMSAGDLASSVPFSGSLAWTAVTLAAASRCIRTSSRTRRLGWGALTALSWGQLAGAHFSVGLVFGTGALLTYLAVAAWSAWHGMGRGGLARVASVVALMAVLAVALNLAYLVPRLVYLPRTELSLGYDRLRALGAELAGVRSPTGPLGRSVGPGWPLKLGAFPGVFLGASLLVVFAGAWTADRRRRTLFCGFAAFGGLCYLVTLSAVSRHVPSAIRSWRLVDAYLHNPEWFAYPMLLALAVLSALGLQAFVEAAEDRHRLAMLAPGVLLWLVVPSLVGSGRTRTLGFSLVTLLVVGALWWSARRPVLVPVLVGAIAFELAAAGTVGYRVEPLPFSPVPTLLQALANPTEPAGRFVVPGPIVDALRTGQPARYAKLPRPRKLEPLPALDVDGMVPNQSDLFGTEDVGSFNPAQLTRYWVFVRAAQRLDIKYNRAFLARPEPIALDLLQIGWLVAPEDRQVPADTAAVASDGQGIGWILYRRTDAPARAEVIPSWRVVAASDAYPSPALDAVLDPAFDPSEAAVLDEDPGLGPAPEPSSDPSGGTATYVSEGPQAVRIEVHADGPGVVLIRSVFDRGWHATVDGRAARVLRTDYLDQGVAVTGGDHVVELRYDDPSIGFGALGSAVAAVVVIAAIALSWRRERRAGAVPTGPAA
jgi:hypothetical protein